MDLYSQIVAVYPETADLDWIAGDILLRDDGDGEQYIAKWNYSKPLPKGLKVGK